VSFEAFNDLRARVVSWCGNNTSKLDASHISSLQEIQRVEQSTTTRIFYIHFCYADIGLHRIYDKIFLKIPCFTDFDTCAMLKFGILFESLPTLTLEHGHCQVAAFDFPQGVPSLVDLLPFEYSKNKTNRFEFGLCDSKDLPFIRENTSR